MNVELAAIVNRPVWTSHRPVNGAPQHTETAPLRLACLGLRWLSFMGSGLIESGDGRPQQIIPRTAVQLHTAVTEPRFRS